MNGPTNWSLTYRFEESCRISIFVFIELFAWFSPVLCGRFSTLRNMLSANNGSRSTLQEVSPVKPVWKPDLYKLQREAPAPHPICRQSIHRNCPLQYGKEYHGVMSSSQCEKLLKKDGDYLIRSSPSCPKDTFVLSMMFNNRIVHYKLYYDEEHYVSASGKRFSTTGELVLDGLVTNYVEQHAGPYIQLMHNLNNYENSPYMTLNRLRRAALRKQMNNANINNNNVNNNINKNHPRRPSNSNNLVIIHNNIDYDKPHMFKTQTFKGLNWCEFCGNFLWGIIAQGVKCEDCGFMAHNKCSERLPADCCPDLKRVRGVFGVDLTTYVKAHGTSVPSIVEKCIAEIEKNGLDVEGLYRISGFQEEIEHLKLYLDKGGENTVLNCRTPDDVNVVAGILKLYLRLLPLPLITHECHPVLLEAICKPAVWKVIACVKDALSILPHAHHNLLKSLVRHLYRVSEHSETNKMTIQNLSTVFAPTLMPLPDLSKYSEGSLPDINNDIVALQNLITHHEYIFEETVFNKF